MLPYRHIYQSGVLFLGYSFGLPVLAADVGSLKDEIIEGQTGFVFKSEDAADLAETIERLLCERPIREIRTADGRVYTTTRRTSIPGTWSAKSTMAVYANLLRIPLVEDYRTVMRRGHRLTSRPPDHPVTVDPRLETFAAFLVYASPLINRGLELRAWPPNNSC